MVNSRNAYLNILNAFLKAALSVLRLACVILTNLGKMWNVVDGWAINWVADGKWNGSDLVSYDGAGKLSDWVSRLFLTNTKMIVTNHSMIFTNYTMIMSNHKMIFTEYKMIFTHKTMILTNHKMLLTVLKMILPNDKMILTN